MSELSLERQLCTSRAWDLHRKTLKAEHALREATAEGDIVLKQTLEEQVDRLHRALFREYHAQALVLSVEHSDLDLEKIIPARVEDDREQMRFCLQQNRDLGKYESFDVID